MNARACAAALLGLVLGGSAHGYPGGTPSYQTDVAPFCASCHSSRSPEALDGAGERADKEMAERKHLAVVLSGEKGYESLSETDRSSLAEQIRALDAASTVSVSAPARVRAGAAFELRVDVTGGAGPAVGVGLVDRAHRWYARPISSAGWQVAGPPRIQGPDGQPQGAWLEKRPEEAGRNLSFVNVAGVRSDAATGAWAHASVVFHLRAPLRPGAYPVVAVFLYGTEKSTVLGYTTDALGQKQVRGGFTGGSGRVLFSTPVQIEVVPEQAPAP